MAPTSSSARRFQVFGRHDLEGIPQLQKLPPSERRAMQAVAEVLPFRVNGYVIDELIDWSRIPDDPMYQLTFPQRGMLSPAQFDRMYGLILADAPAAEVAAAAREIRAQLNPHPAGQTTQNVPFLDAAPVAGLQHKYAETVLFFPSAGQTCHAYCSYCFRWPQFVEVDELKFAARQSEELVRYLRVHPEVTSVLFTGGDPLSMRTKVLRRYVEPLLQAGLEHVRSLRFGSKAPAYWPQRFTTDDDADDLLRLLEEIRASGRHAALMAHYSHPVELAPAEAQRALRRIQDTGAVVRCQAPIIARVNDSAAVWEELWRRQVQLGAVPYYLFVARDTGAHDYFQVPLARAYEIFTAAYSRLSGLERTVRGPVMSCAEGKVLVDGILELAGERVFSLRFVQARHADRVNRPFFARFDAAATWMSDLQPAAAGAPEFFFSLEGLLAPRAGAP